MVKGNLLPPLYGLLFLISELLYAPFPQTRCCNEKWLNGSTRWDQSNDPPHHERLYTCAKLALGYLCSPNIFPVSIFLANCSFDWWSRKACHKSLVVVRDTSQKIFLTFFSYIIIESKYIQIHLNTFPEKSKVLVLFFPSYICACCISLDVVKWPLTQLQQCTSYTMFTIQLHIVQITNCRCVHYQPEKDMGEAAVGCPCHCRHREPCWCVCDFCTSLWTASCSQVRFFHWR